MMESLSQRRLLADYFSETELAQELGRAPRTLQEWRAKRIGPPYTRIGRAYYYAKDQFHKWLASNTHTPVRARRRA